jgi:hypothetical protein
MADPCVGCGKTEIHPFEGLVRSIMDGDRYYVHGMPPLQSLHGACGACKWHIMHRVIPEYCPRCGYPTRVVVLDETSSGSFPHQGMTPGERTAGATDADDGKVKLLGLRGCVLHVHCWEGI